jgi:hypothetical protein
MLAAALPVSGDDIEIDFKNAGKENNGGASAGKRALTAVRRVVDFLRPSASG